MALLATTTLFAHLARRAQLDVLLCAFELVALAAFWRIDRGGRRRARDRRAAARCARPRGPREGPRRPGRSRRSRSSRSSPGNAASPSCARFSRRGRLLLSVAPGLLWITGAVALAPPGFAEQAIVDNLWGRFVHGTAHAGPPWYYLYRLPLDFLPWTLLAPAVVAAGRRALGEGDEERARVWRFLLAWLGSRVPLLLALRGKRGLYLLPVFPAAALLCADAAVSALRAGVRPPHWLSRLLVAVAGLLLLAGLAAPRIASRFGVEVPIWFAVLWAALGGASALAFRAARPPGCARPACWWRASRWPSC